MEDSKKEIIEKQFQDLIDKAKLLYPNIEENISYLNNMTAQTTDLQDYLNLTLQTSAEISSNQTYLL